MGSEIASRALVAVSIMLFTAATLAQDTDIRSYRLGSTASWSEAVSVGIKELALSSPATPDEMDEMIGEAEATQRKIRE